MSDKARIVGSGQAKLLAAVAPDGTVQIAQVDAQGRLLAAPGSTLDAGLAASRLRIWHPWELDSNTPDANGNRCLYRYLYAGTGAQAPDVYTRPYDCEGVKDLTLHVVVGPMKTGTPAVTVVLRGYPGTYRGLLGGAINLIQFQKTLTASVFYKQMFDTNGPLPKASSDITSTNDVRSLNLCAFDVEIYTGASGSLIPVTVAVVGRYDQ